MSRQRRMQMSRRLLNAGGGINRAIARREAEQIAPAPTDTERPMTDTETQEALVHAVTQALKKVEGKD